MVKFAIAYLRVSTEEQSLSPHAQSSAIQQFAASHQLTIHSTYLDRLTGSTPIHDRPGLSHALALSHQHNPRLPIIVAKRDRLARDALLSLQIESLAPILSADSTANGSDPSSLLLKTILAGVAQFEKALVRERTTVSLRAKRQQGYRVGTVPYGYSADPNGLLSPDPNEQATIALVHQLHTQGLSQRAIVRALAAQGCVSRNGKTLHLNQVQALLKRKRTSSAA